MPLFETAALALLLGLTEFLPVPASAHLVLASEFLGWGAPSAGLLFAAHLGALLALVSYYLADLVKIAGYTIESVARKKIGPVAKIGYCLILATIPAAAVWLAFGERAYSFINAVRVIGWASIGSGVLLWLSSYVNRHLVWRNILNIEGERHDSLRHVSVQQALVIGFAQAIALVPGTSRSGITLTAGLFMGLRPEAAARFSFLLGIPALCALMVPEWIQLRSASDASQAWPELLFAGIIAFFASLGSIHLFLKYASKSGMGLFAAYKILLGAALLFFL